jgi:catalase (peroxidase I)
VAGLLFVVCVKKYIIKNQFSFFLTPYSIKKVRLAWHSSGSYSCFNRTGGSDGASMRFSPEADHGGNAGLDKGESCVFVRVCV